MKLFTLSEANQALPLVKERLKAMGTFCTTKTSVRPPFDQ